MEHRVSVKSYESEGIGHTRQEVGIILGAIVVLRLRHADRPWNESSGAVAGVRHGEYDSAMLREVVEVAVAQSWFREKGASERVTTYIHESCCTALARKS